jgi:glucose/arabinose dehydrogenase
LALTMVCAACGKAEQRTTPTASESEMALTSPLSATPVVVSAAPSVDTAATGRADTAKAAEATWREAGCLACHGIGGVGLAGPAIDLSADVASLVAAVRAPAGGAHAAFAGTPSDAELAALRDWLREVRAAGSRPEPPASPAGVFAVEQLVSGLPSPVALAWGPAPAGSARAGEDVLYVSLNGQSFPSIGENVGSVEWLDGAERHPYIAELERPLGLLFVPTADGPELLVSTRGQVSAWRDVDGDGRGDRTRVVVDDLPAWKLHQNNIPVLGPDGLVYLGMGTQTNADAADEQPLNGTILRFPPSGGTPEVFASGFRNPFDLAFGADGTLYATDNGVDPPVVADAPDELNRVVEGGFYGHPEVFGDAPPSAGAAARNPVAPIGLFPPHASADGLLRYGGAMYPELDGQLVAAEFGSYLAGYESVGRRLVLAVLSRTAAGTSATMVPLVAPFPGRPLDVVEGPDGSLYVTEFENGGVWRVSRPP